MIWFSAILAIVFFVFACRVLRLIPVAGGAIHAAREATAVIRDAEMDEEQKECEIRAAALRLLRDAAVILLCGAGAVAASLVPILVLHWAGAAPFPQTMQLLFSWQFLVGVTVAALVVAWAARRAKRSAAESSSASRYSVLDRAIHRLAFSGRFIQAAAADVDTSLSRRRFEHLEVRRPIFITSLPRAGTTLMLEVLDQMAGLATNTYRDMPFVCAPLIWNALSSRFRQRAQPIERAHGDGMLVGYDSPEAFEEVAWKTFWPKKYQADRIELWSADERNEEFEEFFADNLRKILAVRLGDAAADGRYFSKNNNNICRLAYLKKLFPDCVLLVPFRDPVSQAASMHRQHQNFLAQHREDPFSKRYMGDIGHYEFGELHRPFEFPAAGNRDRYGPDRLDYWIGYWIDAFEHILGCPEPLTFVSYERACEDGKAAVETLCRELAIPASDAGREAAERFRPARSHGVEARGADEQQLHHARQLHGRLLQRSIL